MLGGKADMPGWLRHIPANWGCDQTVSGVFDGFDSAHVYSFPGKIGYTYTFTFEADVPWWKGTVLALYDAESGKRVAHARERWNNAVELVYEAQRDVKYLVALYTVSWWARGDYTVHAACEVTGCKVNSECHSAEYCHHESGCGTNGPGSCKPMPAACIELHDPVCGCNGKTYGNACKAHAAGVNVDHEGPCPTGESKCEAMGGYCAHFLDTCKEGFVGSEPAGCPLGKSAQCCLPAVQIEMNRDGYDANEQVSAMLVNNMEESAFLSGCSAFRFEKRVDGVWVLQQPEKVCIWEGIAREVTSGATFAETLSPREAGTWRVTAEYGVGCVAGLPLSQAGCTSTDKAQSAPFLVKDCPLIAMPDPDLYCPGGGSLEPKLDADGICVIGYACN
jgi:hypothetical protein